MARSGDSLDRAVTSLSWIRSIEVQGRPTASVELTPSVVLSGSLNSSFYYLGQQGIGSHRSRHEVARSLILKATVKATPVDACGHRSTFQHVGSPVEYRTILNGRWWTD